MTIPNYTANEETQDTFVTSKYHVWWTGLPAVLLIWNSTHFLLHSHLLTLYLLICCIVRNCHVQTILKSLSLARSIHSKEGLTIPHPYHNSIALATQEVPSCLDISVLKNRYAQIDKTSCIAHPMSSACCFTL